LAEGWIVDELGNTFCATAVSDRQEHAINIDMISRTVTAGHQKLQTPELNVLHGLLQTISIPAHFVPAF
jgi:CheY-specific phosphatase CheX